MSATALAVLEPRLVGDVIGKFFVPSYQRGYRWGKTEVSQLLDDIWDSNGRDYFLQPIVVKRRGNAEWELVDGQQRLTTLYLIFQYMLNSGLQSTGANFELEYETRARSATYLRELGTTDEVAASDNIDFFHMRAAYSVIAEWFETRAHRKQNDANKFYSYLYESVQVIWYEVPAEVDATELFTRLNVGRIPLTDAELVKALLLTRARQVPDVGDRTREIVADWDTIERDLQDPEVWAFVAGERAAGATRIDLIFDLLARADLLRRRVAFETFEALRERIDSAPLEFWEEVLDLHATIRWWFEDRELFHKIGFLRYHGVQLGELLKMAQGSAKSQFSRALTERIRARVGMSAEAVRDLDYERAPDRCQMVLTLMNVVTVSNLAHSTERYSFAGHSAESWSLEHIHAQNAEALRTVDAWRQWLVLHRQVIADVPTIDEIARAELLEAIDLVVAEPTVPAARALEPRIAGVLAQDDAEDDMHSIANLALLASRDNTALTNSMFEVKRRKILELEKKGSFVPICTRQVFLKYFTGADAQQVHFWSAQDRAAYLDAMIDVLSPYLDKEVAA